MIILQQARGLLSSNDQLALDLPLAETKSINARVGPTPVFTRASTATFIGSDGLIQSAAVNEPRFEHDPLTGVCGGLLLEQSRTNSITGSNAFNSWTTSNSTVAASSVVTPEGTADAWKVVEDMLLANHTVIRFFTAVSGTTYTASVWLKSAENGFAFVGLTGGGFAPAFISVNLSTGAVITTTGTPIGATSVAHSNGWWRVSFSLAATASLSSVIDIRLSRDGLWGNRPYLGNGVNGMYCYGAQVEAGATATSYIPTVASSVVRSADVCSITGANFSGMWNQSEGTLLSRTQKTSTNANAFVISASDGGFNNETDLRYNSVSQTAALINVSGASQITGFQANITSGSEVKQSIAYKLNDCAYAANGASPILDTSALIPTVNRLTIGNVAVAGSTFYLNGTIASIRYFRKRLPNAKLQSLTA